jgi:hypothetical protein
MGAAADTTALDFRTRRLYYNRCNPSESLSPADERNLDLDSWDGEPVRGINWVERLAGKIELSNVPAFELFTGLPGAGKSTELRRLAARLERKDKAHLLTVLIDAEDVLDLTNPIDVPDVIASILLHAESALLVAEGKDPEKALQEGYMARLWDWLKTTDVELKQAEFSIPSGPKLVAEMKTRPSLRLRVRKLLAANLSSFLSEARDELKLYEERARKIGYQGLVVIFDSLEHLKGVSTNWNEVLGSAERIFAGGAPYLRLPVHVLYTVPPALVARHFTEVQFLPMISLRSREGAPCEQGIAASREIVRMRIPDDVLTVILGPQVEERVGRLIRWSGGYPRELIRLIQSVLALPIQPISENDLERVVNELRDTYRKIVPANAFEWLAEVEKERYVTVRDDEHRKMVDWMLSNSAVLRYLNGNEWFDLHPAVAAIPGLHKERPPRRPPSKG